MKNAMSADRQAKIKTTKSSRACEGSKKILHCVQDDTGMLILNFDF